MKQGQASRSGAAGRKVEPTPKAVNPGGVGSIGTKLAHDGFKTAVYSGRGYTAPMAGGKNHGNCGSQGRH